MSGAAIPSAGLALGSVAPEPLRLFDVKAFLAGAESIGLKNPDLRLFKSGQLMVGVNQYHPDKIPE